MNKLFNYMKSDEFKIKVKPEIFRVLAVIFFTFIYGLGVKWFLDQEAVKMYASGVPGISQLIRDFLHYRTSVELSEQQTNFLMSGLIILINIPVLLLGWFGISKKFTIYSLISVLIQSTVIGFIPTIDIGLNSAEHQVTLAILGGLVTGIGIGGALKFGTSTGGLDIVAQYFSFKKGKTVGSLTLAMNVAIALLGGLIVSGAGDGAPIAWVISAYTILRILITTMVLDKIHTSYQTLSVEIITTIPEELGDTIIERVGRGATVINVQGAYHKTDRKLLMVAVSTYELDQVIEIINEIDPGAFVLVKPVRQIVGNFTRKTIA